MERLTRFVSRRPLLDYVPLASQDAFSYARSAAGRWPRPGVNSNRLTSIGTCVREHGMIVA